MSELLTPAGWFANNSEETRTAAEREAALWPGWTGVRDMGHHDKHAGHGDRDTTDERQYR